MRRERKQEFISGLIAGLAIACIQVFIFWRLGVFG